MNSGDHLNNELVLETNVKCLINYDLVYFNLLVVDGDLQDIILLPKELRFSYFFDGGTLCHPSTFIKRELFKVVGLYDESLKIVSDWKFFIIALCRFNATYNYVDAILSTFYKGGISTLNENQYLMKSERDSILKTEFPFLINDTMENFRLQRILRNLRKSRKINWLIKLGLLDKF